MKWSSAEVIFQTHILVYARMLNCPERIHMIFSKDFRFEIANYCAKYDVPMSR
jgi:hypothetical protein